MSILRYRIESIVTKKFVLSESIGSDKLTISLSFKFQVNEDEKVVMCFSKYEYTSASEKLMSLELECYFKIEEEYFKSLYNNDDVLIIKQDILQYMATIAVGVARGEIHARCQLAGSRLQERVLPPVDLTKIITTPAEFTR